MVPEIVTLKEAAQILKISKHTAYRQWHRWRDQGIKILKLGPNGQPRFYLSEVLRVVEQSPVNPAKKR